MLHLGIDQKEQVFLQRYHFDCEVFERLQKELRDGQFVPQRNRLTKTVSMPIESDYCLWPSIDHAEIKAIKAIGKKAIQSGQVAIVVLNGGMATRFNEAVKGIVEVMDGESFLSLRLKHMRKIWDTVPVFLMNSFATQSATLSYLETHKNFGFSTKQLHLLEQNISLRMTPSGDIFRDSTGRLGYYAPGHGELLQVLFQSDAFQSFKAQNGKYVVVCNVDNLGATLSDIVLGLHIRGGKDATVEVAERLANDKGGAPLKVEGHLEIVEAFRFPVDFDATALKVFNTNTFVFNVNAIKPDYDLTWFRVDKKSQEQAVVQFERLVGEVTAFLDAQYLLVPRDGSEGRFLPVKSRKDLVSIRSAVQERFGRYS